MLSRVADSLYWMSRYIERAEHTARVMAVKLESMVEQTPEDATASWTRVIEALTGEKQVIAPH
ncbi:MAG TPA: alpha-E domain-containing protein, partial [Rhizomicrobium sp.]|nr:alpha-E domain-containing protein [Rhizomicrobium sp.]